jgi:hypothetical protein
MPHLHHQSRHPLLVILALGALVLAVVAPNALAAGQTSPAGPPNFPTAVPTHPGALTYASGTATEPTAQAPGPPNFPTYVPSHPGALPYASGAPAQARPISIDTNDGVAGLPFALALAGALIAGFAASSSLHLLRGRRRRAAHPA